MKDKSRGFTHYVSTAQRQGSHEVINLINDFAGVVALEYDHVPDRLWSILDDNEHSSSLKVRYQVGAIALEAATAMTRDPNEQLELIGRAKSCWEDVTTSAARFDTVNVDTFRARMSLATLPAMASIALNQELPTLSIQSTMYERLIGVAEQTLDFTSYNIDRTRTKMSSSKAIEVIGLQAELAFILVHQRFSLMTPEVGQLALMSLFSQDFGLATKRGSEFSTGWDVTIFQEDDGELTTPARVQIKSSTAAKARSKQSAEGIIDICINEDLAPRHLVDKYRPSWALRSLTAEASLESQEDLSHEEARDLDTAKSQLRGLTSRTLDAIDEWAA